MRVNVLGNVIKEMFHVIPLDLKENLKSAVPEMQGEHEISNEYHYQGSLR